MNSLRKSPLLPRLVRPRVIRPGLPSYGVLIAVWYCRSSPIRLSPIDIHRPVTFGDSPEELVIKITPPVEIEPSRLAITTKKWCAKAVVG